MVDRLIDYDRGVLIKTEPLTGVDVFMYIDSPGEYLNAHALSVPASLARAAGYDIDGDAKKKLIIDRMRAAKNAIESEVNGVIADEEKEIIKLDGGYSLLGIGLGRYLLRDPDENILTQTALSREAAEKVASVLAQSEKPVEVKGPAQPVKK